MNTLPNKSMAKKILIIEDEHLLAEMYVTRFTREGFKVSIARSVKQGIELIEKVRSYVKST